MHEVRAFMAKFEELVNTAKDRYRVRGRDMIGNLDGHGDDGCDCDVNE